MAVRYYDKDQVIFRQGEYGLTMFEMKSGSVGIFTAYGTPEEQKLTVAKALGAVPAREAWEK